MIERRRESSHSLNRPGPEVFSACAAVAALFAPATLTGLPVVDAIERALFVGMVSFVGAHGRRWAWLAAAVAIAVPARGISLVIALVALTVVVVAARFRRRSRRWGAIAIGLMLNAALWYPATTPRSSIALVAGASIVLCASGLPMLRRSPRRFARRVLISTIVVAVLAGIGAALAMALAYASVQSGGESARAALEEARDGDGPGAKADLAEATSHFDRASSLVNGPLATPALLVPGLSQQVQGVQTTVDQGRRISATADDLVATADYDRLQYDGQLDVQQVRDLAEPTARADQALVRASDELAELDDIWLLPPLRTRIDQFSEDIDEARRDTDLAARLLRVTPGLFGADGDRRYLVVFMTPAELRGAGGFIGSYAELEAIDGDVTLTRSGRINDLITGPNQGSRTLTGPADYLRRYGRFRPQDFVQDVTLSPDFPSVAQVLHELYPQVGGSEIDGVIAVDPTGLAALLELTGPVTVDGLDGLDEQLTAANAVEVLTRSQYLDVPDRAERGEILTEATRVTFDKLVSSSLPAPRKLAQTLSPAARSGHLRLWSPNADEQRVFEQLGADGSLAIPTGSDGFSVVQQNTGNNKLDAYLQRSITYLPTVDASTGELRATMRIELHNGVPSLDMPRAIVDNTRGLPQGTNLTWLTIFTRSVVTSATIDGVDAKLGPSRERDLNAWDTQLIAIGPGKSVVIEVELIGGVDLRDGYALTVLPQPVANPDQFTVEVQIDNGATDAPGGTEARLLDDEPLTAPTRVHLPIEPV